MPKQYPHLTLTWVALTYTSQVSEREVGNHQLEEGSGNYVIKGGLRYNQQYKICLITSSPACDHASSTCSYVKVPSAPSPKNAKGVPLYLTLGPVHSKNLTAVWAELPRSHAPDPALDAKVSKGFKVTWRRVEGLVGHPGHASNLVTSRHLIRGLIPGTRYEVCVGETLTPDVYMTCDVIVTEEDVPGPPIAESGSCSIQARGTHWRCDVTWAAPEKTHGKIRGYLVEWKDREGYVLMESLPRGVLCDPLCYESQVVNFHPTEVCVSARTRAGQGWESCAPIHDVSGRILAFFELKVMLIIGITILIYQLGPAILRAVLKCCLRGLYRHVEGEKKHPV